MLATYLYPPTPKIAALPTRVTLYPFKVNTNTKTIHIVKCQATILGAVEWYTRAFPIPPVDTNRDPCDVTQNTLFRVDRLTDVLLSYSHRQGPNGPPRRPGARTLVRMMFCELNYTQGQCLHIAVSVSSVHHRLCRLGCERAETLRSVSKISVHTCLGP